MKINHLRKFSLGDFLKFRSMMNRKDKCGGVATLRSKVLTNEPQSMHPEENGAVADRFA